MTNKTLNTICKVIVILICILLFGECASDNKHVSRVINEDSVECEVPHFFNLYKTYYNLSNNDTITGVITSKYNNLDIQVSDEQYIYNIESTKIFNNYEKGDTITFIRTYIPHKRKMLIKYTVL